MTAFLGSLLCRIGWHWFEKEPSHKEFIKATGVDFLFFSEGLQKGAKHCVRPNCNATQRVYRRGWLGHDGKATSWRKLYPQMEAQIDALPKI